jgi:hypothetical protein
MITQKTKLLTIFALAFVAIASAYFLAKQSPFCKTTQANAAEHISIDENGE